MARPTSYKEEYAEQAFKLCLLGAKDTELGDFFGVSEQTINSWKQKFPEFLEALKTGKASADANVAHSLYRRALGYSHPEDDIKVVSGVVVATPTVKHYPPDTTACIFWLKNRDKENWRDRHEIDATHRNEDRKAEDLTDEELANIIAEGGKGASKKKDGKGKAPSVH